MDSKLPYKYCIVPLCTNTTCSTPEKYFFYVPRDNKVRNKWCKIMRREERLSTKTSRYCCEDHFNIESDTENYIQWKLCGGTLRLKQGAVPTKFECQKKRKSIVPRPGYEKRQRIEFYETLLTKDVRPSVAQQDIEFISCGDESVDVVQPSNPPPSVNFDKIELPKTETTELQHEIEPQKKDAQTQTVKQENYCQCICHC